MEAVGEYCYNTREPLFIPVSSDIGRLAVPFDGYKVGTPALGFGANELVMHIHHALSTLRTKVVTAKEVTELVAALGTASAELQSFCVPPLSRLALVWDSTASRSLLLADSGGRAEAYEEYANYDSYFGFRRVSDLDQFQFMAQIVRTAHRILTELPMSTVGIDEVSAILDAIVAMLVWFVPATGHRTSDIKEPLSADQLSCQPDSSTRSDVEYADYRWILGHHLFNLYTIFCRNALQVGVAAIDRGDPERASTAINDAAVFLRGTTAAMWFAGNFPATMYLRHTRPSMAKCSGKASGFSGTHNLDYLRLRQAADSLTTAILRQAAPAAWPMMLRQAILRWFETEAEDVEHHVLIAASKVGIIPSLLQESVATYLPSGMMIPPAVEMLRELLTTRRKVAKACLAHVGVLQ